MAGVFAGFVCWCAGEREHVGAGGVGDDVAVLAGSDFPDGVAGEVAAGPVRHGPAGRMPGDVGAQAGPGAGEQGGGAARGPGHGGGGGGAPGGGRGVGPGGARGGGGGGAGGPRGGGGGG